MGLVVVSRVVVGVVDVATDAEVVVGGDSVVVGPCVVVGPLVLPPGPVVVGP